MKQFEVEPQSRHVMTKIKTKLAHDPPSNCFKKRKNNPPRLIYAAEEQREESPELDIWITPERLAAAEKRVEQQRAETEEQKKNGTYVDLVELYHAELERVKEELRRNPESRVEFDNPYRPVVLARMEKDRIERKRQAKAEVGNPDAQAVTYAEHRRMLEESRLYMRRYAIEEAARTGQSPPSEDPFDDSFYTMEPFIPSNERADAPPGPSYEEIMGRVKPPQVISEMLEEEKEKKEEAERLAREAEAAKESTSNNRVKYCTKRKRAHREAEEAEKCQ